MYRPALALILAVAVAAAPAHADTCDPVAELAGEIMAQRQAGVSQAELERLVGEVLPARASGLVAGAWAEARADDPAAREAVAFHYAALAYESCRSDPRAVHLAGK